MEGQRMGDGEGEEGEGGGEGEEGRVAWESSEVG